MEQRRYFTTRHTILALVFASFSSIAYPQKDATTEAVAGGQPIRGTPPPQGEVVELVSEKQRDVRRLVSQITSISVSGPYTDLSKWPIVSCENRDFGELWMPEYKFVKLSFTYPSTGAASQLGFFSCYHEEHTYPNDVDNALYDGRITTDEACSIYWFLRDCKVGIHPQPLNRLNYIYDYNFHHRYRFECLSSNSVRVSVFNRQYYDPEVQILQGTFPMTAMDSDVAGPIDKACDCGL